jgi:hypothetical protein
MSQSLTPYIVDLDHLKAVEGSGDKRLLAEIEAKYDKALARGEKQAAGRPTTREALRRIVRGDSARMTKVERLRWGSPQGYALMFLCDHFGRKLENNAFQNIHGDFFELLPEMDPFLRTGPPLPVTRPDDYPFIFHFTIEASKRELKRLARLPVNEADPDAAAARRQYEGWLRESVEQGFGLVAFYH